MKFMKNSVLLASIALTIAVNTGCTSIQERYEVSGKSITVERKTTNRAYIDQVKLKEANGEASLVGIVMWHINSHGVLPGKLYISLMDNNNRPVKNIEKDLNRRSPTTRQLSFEHALGRLPNSVSKISVSYGD